VVAPPPLPADDLPPAPVVPPVMPPVADLPEPDAPLPPAPSETMVYAPPPEPERAAEVATLSWDGSSVEIEERVTVIGRSSECDITLDDANVSRRHAEVRRENGNWFVVDLGSTNGIEVNGKRTNRAKLEHDDRIVLGQTEVTFERS
jgi:hypothetical protein